MLEQNSQIRALQIPGHVWAVNVTTPKLSRADLLWCFFTINEQHHTALATPCWVLRKMPEAEDKGSLSYKA